MSRIGNAPVTIPEGVEITQADGMVTIKGKKGELTQEMDSCVEMKIEDNSVTFSRKTNAPEHRAKHGLYRSLVQNMVVGVSEGFKKELEINGVGYRAQLQGNSLKLNLGLSHDVDFPIPSDVTVSAPKPTQIIIEGIDPQRVGQVAANIREWRKPEPYKGKGIKYIDEYIFRKEGKKK